MGVDNGIYCICTVLDTTKYLDIFYITIHLSQKNIIMTCMLSWKVFICTPVIYQLFYTGEAAVSSSSSKSLRINLPQQGLDSCTNFHITNTLHLTVTKTRPLAPIKPGQTAIVFPRVHKTLVKQRANTVFQLLSEQKKVLRSSINHCERCWRCIKLLYK